jgi:hypothetical protein
MPKHDVTLDLHTKVVAHKDIEVSVRSDDSKLGTLLVSKGNIEWLPANNSVNKYRLSWERFAEVMQEHGSRVKK